MANHPRVVGDGDLEWSEHSHGEKFAYRRKQPIHSPRSWVELAAKVVTTSSPSASCFSMS
jgi:hypothetical protein